MSNSENMPETIVLKTKGTQKRSQSHLKANARVEKSLFKKFIMDNSLYDPEDDKEALRGIFNSFYCEFIGPGYYELPPITGHRSQASHIRNSPKISIASCTDPRKELIDYVRKAFFSY